MLRKISHKFSKFKNMFVFSEKCREIPTKFHRIECKNMWKWWCLLRKRSGKREIFKMNTPVLILNKFGRLSLLKCLGGNGGKVCKSCRCRQEFSHEYLLAKFGFATPRTSLSSLEVISFSYSFGYLLSNTGFFNVARRGSDSEGNLWSQDHSQQLSAEHDLLSSNHKN